MGLLNYLNMKPAAAEKEDELVGGQTAPPPASEEKAALPDFEKAGTKEEPHDREVDYDRLIREKGYYGLFKDLNRKPDFEGEEKRLKRYRQLAAIGDAVKSGGDMFSSLVGGRSFTPTQSQVPAYNERLQRLRAARESYDADLNGRSLSMIFKDYERRRGDERTERAAEAAARKAAGERQWNGYKFEADMGLKKEKLRKEEETFGKRLAETNRHNLAVESINRERSAAERERANAAKANAAKANGNASRNKGEVAYVTKYGDVLFDNPKNKRAATLSVLEVMRKGARDDGRNAIDKLIYDMKSGEVNSFSNAEMFVSQHLNDDPAALKHLYEYAGKYGHVSVDGGQEAERQKALRINEERRIEKIRRETEADKGEAGKESRRVNGVMIEGTGYDGR